MSSPVTSADFEAAIPSNNANACEKLTALFNLPSLMAQLTEYLLDSAGNPSDAFKTALASALTPAGQYAYAAGPSMGDQWLLCDGRAISRTTYANLFAVIGTTFGVGDGSTTFNIPNGSRKSLIGAGGGWTAGLVVGEENHTQTIAEMPSHSHNWDGPEARNAEQGGGANIIWKGTATAATALAGGGQPFNVVHPCIVGYLFIHI